MKPTDASVRQAALTPEQSFIVQAPAGSGKTELLTQRFLKLLGGVIRPESVLAITFTRKATQEMRERIMGRLMAAHRGEVPEEEHELLAHELACKVIERNRQLGWGLAEDPGRLQIFTIDGLCARIAGRFPVPGEGVSTGRIVEDARPMYREAARLMIESLAVENDDTSEVAAFERILARQDGSAGRLNDLLADMLERRDLWLDKVGVDHAAMAEVLVARQAIEWSCLVRLLGEAALDDAIAALSLLAAGADQPVDVIAEAEAYRESGLAPRERMEHAHAVLSLFLTKGGTLAKRFGPTFMAGQQAGRDDAIARLKAVSKDWYASEQTADAFHRFMKAPPLDRESSQAVLEDHRTLLKLAEAYLRVLFTERGQCDFLHVAFQALRALAPDQNPGEALLVEDAAIHHILMDEFQDTSSIQYQLVDLLTREWGPDEGRSLFLVGDPMQSIYRFRKAEVNRFRQVFEEERLGKVAVRALRLECNFRSREEVIDRINAEFPRIFSSPSPVSLGTVGYSGVKAMRGEGGCVRTLAHDASAGPEGEARELAERISAQVASNPEVRIGVLAAKRKTLGLVARALRETGVRFEGIDLEGLSDRTCALDALAITRALLHSGDRIAWLSLLRAPACGLDVNELYHVAPPGVDVAGRLRDPQAWENLSTTKGKRIRRLAEVMELAARARARQSLARIVEAAWIGLHGPQACESGTDVENARVVFETLAQVEIEEPGRLLEAFEERLERRYAVSEAAHVQLMTIHKAKGLEFDIVWLPGLGQTGRNRNDARLMVVQEFAEVDTAGPSGALMAPLSERSATKTGLYQYLDLLDREQERSEQQRQLYVAMTRARRELWLSGCHGWKSERKVRQPAPPAGSFMEMLWPLFAAAIPGDREEGATRQDGQAVPELPHLVLENEPPLQVTLGAPLHCVTGLSAPTVGNRSSMAVGEALHRWLEVLHDQWDEAPREADLSAWLTGHRPALRSSLRTMGAPDGELDDLLLRLEGYLMDALTSGRQFVSPGNRDGSWAELVIHLRDGVHLRRRIIDRLYREQDGSLRVVDYKTGADTEENRARWAEQLKTYREQVTEGFGEVGVKTGIFRPGDSSLIEP